MSLTRLFLTAFIALSAVFTASADGTKAFSYDTGAGVRGSWGTGLKENYDVAIRVTEPELVGTQITGVNVPLLSDSCMSGFKVWLSNNLTVQTIDGVRQNVPDIVSVDVVPEGNMLSVTFTEPYTLTENGVYVGYSFTVDSLFSETYYPVMVVDEIHADGFYLRSSRTYRNWTDMAGSVGLASTISVNFTGDFDENSVGIHSLGKQVVVKGQQGAVKMSLINNGCTPVSSVDYTYDVAGLQGEAHYDLPEPIAAQYNKVEEVSLPLPVMSDVGAYTLSLAITKVNGAANETQASATAAFDVYSFAPVHRPLLEEYTGLWCQYCPRGFVGLELMNKYYPDLFVALSYHNKDIMATIQTYNYPNYVSGFPDAWLDRVKNTDAYSGDSASYIFGIDDVYLARAAEIAPASIDIEAGWSDEKQEYINVITTVKFAKQLDNANYRVAYFLVADDLHGDGDDWEQTNYYNNKTAFYICEGMDQFVDADLYVSGLHFNDVVVLAPDLKGVRGSLPSYAMPDETATHNYQFTVADAVNIEGASVIQDKSKLRVVAAIVDADTGEVLNANKASLQDILHSGISGVTLTDGEVASEAYYDMSGRRVSAPSKGIYIKSVTYKDGTVGSSKVIIR